jgi:TrmH family RNA methyltransferase
MPMLGRADSLNAAVAGAVLAYEALAHLRKS